MARVLVQSFRGCRIWLGLACLSLLLSSNQAVWAEQILDGIAAIVNDNIITISEVREMMALEATDLDKRYYGAELEMRRRDLFRNTLRPLIDVEVQIERAKALQMKVEDAEIDRQVRQLKDANQLTDAQLDDILQSRGLTVEMHREQISRSLLLSKVINYEVRSRLVVTEAELQEAYEKAEDRFQIAGELTVSHILFLVPEQAPAEADAAAKQKAEVVLQKLRAGGDFAALAKQYSEGPSARNDGSLGTFRTGELLPGFEEAIASMKPGDISDPVRTRIGWHIIRLDSAKDGGRQPLDAVRDELSAELKRAKFERNYQEWVESLRQQAYIKILYEG